MTQNQYMHAQRLIQYHISPFREKKHTPIPKYHITQYAYTYIYMNTKLGLSCVSTSVQSVW